MTVTELHATSGRHPACREETVSVSWKHGGKRYALWVNAKGGRSHFGTCPARRKSAVSAEDIALIEAIDHRRPTQREAEAWLAVPQNRTALEKIREAMKA